MLSLNARLLIAASVVLAAFLSFTGLALDRAFRESALSATRDRLHGQSLLLLSAAEVTATEIIIPSELPEARYSSPASGLYAEVVAPGGKIVWQSRSSLGQGVDYPRASFDGVSVFEESSTLNGRRLFANSFGITWELDSGLERRLEIRVAEDAKIFDRQVREFRSSLVSWFTASAVVLLLIQAVILRWGLSPLRRVAAEVSEIETGEREELGSNYPPELRRLTENLNELIGIGRKRLARYRNALDDLAHSLKTPLAVLRSVAENNIADANVRANVVDEVERMHTVINHQLQRGAASGKVPLSTPVDIRSTAQRLALSLAKVYARKNIEFDIVDDGGVFRGDEGDLVELLGNLMDNACKWARHRVRVRFASNFQQDAARTVLTIDVEDDGPGFDDLDETDALRRGAHTSSDKAGQGIGLAVVREVVEEIYGGRVEVGQSEAGGARVRLLF